MQTADITEQKVIVRQAIAELLHFFNEAEAKYKAENFEFLSPDVFEAAGGTKYIRIAQSSGSSRSVHCFIDAVTGDVYKAAGWKAPALNGARFNILDADSLADLKSKWNSHGSYLYKR